MVAIEYEHLLAPALVTIGSCHQMAVFAKKVGKARRKFQVPVPNTTGDEGFVRVFRAHQNSVEFYPGFLASMWTCSLLCHQVPASLLGVIYLISRERYFNGYSEAAEKRLPGFRMCVLTFYGMNVLSILGAGNMLIKLFFGRSVLGIFRSSS